MSDRTHNRLQTLEAFAVEQLKQNNQITKVLQIEQRVLKWQWMLVGAVFVIATRVADRVFELLIKGWLQ